MNFKSELFPACCNPDLPCCFRGAGLAYSHECSILRDTEFKSGLCHFRKLRREGANQYDLARASPAVDADPDPRYTESNNIWRATRDEY